jgi:hypothetical protein
MPGSAFIVKLSAADRAAFGDELAQEISGHVGRSLDLTVSNDAALKESGPIIEDAEGRQVWDNVFWRINVCGRNFRQIAMQTAVAASNRQEVAMTTTSIRATDGDRISGPTITAGIVRRADV